MARTRIKICGITRPEDAALAAELGADAIGLNFVGGRRRIDARTAAAILRSVPSLVTPVALAACQLAAAPDACSPTQILNDPLTSVIGTFQIYGELPAELLEGRRGLRIWITEALTSRASLTDIAARFYIRTLRPAALLLDAGVKGQLGGTGKAFDWKWISDARAAGELKGLPPIVLAGGLSPENVAEAIRIVRPYAVDVSSGVELPGKLGIKDASRMRAFVEAVRSTDS